MNKGLTTVMKRRDGTLIEIPIADYWYYKPTYKYIGFPIPICQVISKGHNIQLEYKGYTDVFTKYYGKIRLIEKIYTNLTAEYDIYIVEIVFKWSLDYNKPFLVEPITTSRAFGDDPEAFYKNRIDYYTNRKINAIDV